MGGPNFNATVTGCGNPGVRGFSTSGIGTNGNSHSSFGVNAFSNTNIGVSSISNGTGDRGIGMDGFTRNGAVDVRGISLTSTGVLGTGPFSGVQGTSNSGVGTGVRGISGIPSTTSTSGVGVFGSGLIDGVRGEGGEAGVHGIGSGVAGMGVFAEAEGTAVFAQSREGIAIRGSGRTAGDFQGSVNVMVT